MLYKLHNILYKTYLAIPLLVWIFITVDMNNSSLHFAIYIHPCDNSSTAEYVAQMVVFIEPSAFLLVCITKKLLVTANISEYIYRTEEMEEYQPHYYQLSICMNTFLQAILSEFMSRGDGG